MLISYVNRVAVTRMLGPQQREPRFGSCAAMANLMGKFVHSTLLQFTQLYEQIPGYRQWWIWVYEIFEH